LGLVRHVHRASFYFLLIMSTNHTTGPNLDAVIERLNYAASKAGSIGMGEYTRVHKKDLATLLEAFAEREGTDAPLVRDLTARIERVKHFLTPESASKTELQEAVDLAVNVLAVGAARGVKPELI
jgi:uncharacterized protein YheU (UPF0270 family)